MRYVLLVSIYLSISINLFAQTCEYDTAFRNHPSDLSNKAATDCFNVLGSEKRQCENNIKTTRCSTECEKLGRCSAGFSNGYCKCGKIANTNTNSGTTSTSGSVMSTLESNGIVVEEEVTSSSGISNSAGGSTIYERNKLDCLNEIKLRPNKSPFITNTQKLDAQMIKDNPELYNLLAQISKVNVFKKSDLCFDFFKLGKNKVKMSFGFKKPFTPAESTEYLKVAKQLGTILKKVGTAKESKVENINIFGFADQQHSYPKDFSGHTGQYKIVTDSLKLTEYPYAKVPEILELQKILDGMDQTETVFKSTPEKYMSTVRTNQLLGLNRAIQMKRGILTGYPEAVIPEMKDLGNGFSSCRNEISRGDFLKDYTADKAPGTGLGGLKAKAETCDRRRIVVVEADLTTYSKFTPYVPPKSWFKMEGGITVPYSSYFASCMISSGDASSSLSFAKKYFFFKKTEEYKYSLSGKKQEYIGAASDEDKRKNDAFYLKTYPSVYSAYLSLKNSTVVIADILKATNGKTDKDIEALIDKDSKYDESFTSLKTLKLTDNDIGKILSSGYVPRFSYYSRNDIESKTWTIFYKAKKDIISLDPYPKTLDFFTKSRLFVDEGCKFKAKYPKSDVDILPLLKKQITDKTYQLTPEIKALLKSEKSITADDYLYAAEIPKGDCVFLTTYIFFSQGCPTPSSTKSDSGGSPAVAASNIFPNYHFNDSSESTEMSFNGPTFPELTKQLGTAVGVTNFTTKAAIDLVNGWLCDGKQKPGLLELIEDQPSDKQLDEQDDCK